MKNPWIDIELDDYEKHMSLKNVFQLQTMNKIMKSQFYSYPVQSVMILGVAGGNGLEHIDKKVFKKVYGVDVNAEYLKACIARYPELQGVFYPVFADITNDDYVLPVADLLIANLFIEYVGYENFQKVIKAVKPKYISCVIQKNSDVTFVSDSPYTKVFDGLNTIHRQIEDVELINYLNEIRYKKILQSEEKLPNGKSLIRIDFTF